MKKSILFKLIILCSLIILSCNYEKKDKKIKDESIDENAEDWTQLFNGTDLTGWRIIGSEDADFDIVDGVLVGTTIKGIPNSFLVTGHSYSDFILELDFKIDKGINSGVQIRSDVYEEETTTPYLNGSLEESERTWPAGRLYGYQVEIDPSERAWSGGFYEEGGRGWLQPLNENEAAREAYKPEEWNHLKIKAQDNHFETWINGVKAADYTDDKLDSGFIGLQLHSAWKDEQVGKKVWFRDLKIQEL